MGFSQENHPCGFKLGMPETMPGSPHVPIEEVPPRIPYISRIAHGDMKSVRAASW